MDGVQLSSYLRYLPDIYQKLFPGQTDTFSGEFLNIFEKILSGIDDEKALDLVSIEKILDNIHDYFDPLYCPGPPLPDLFNKQDFVAYLAKWVALTLDLQLDVNWDAKTKRRIIQKIISFYKRRGTRAALIEYLRLFVGTNVTIDEFLSSITVGEETLSTIGINTFIGGLPPHFFIVTITFTSILGLGIISNTIKTTRAIIELEKPAHTYYKLRFIFPGIFIGQRATVGSDTIIGTGFPFFV